MESDMYAYKSKVRITDDRKLVLRLPAEMPEGEAEVIVLSDTAIASVADVRVQIEKLEQWINQLPSVPELPLHSIDRGELYR